MAKKPARDKSQGPPPRRARGFTRAGGLIAAQMQTVAARRGFALARLRTLWPEIVGSDLAAICQPEKLTTARGPAGGLLTLSVAAAHGPELQMQIPQLRDRVNAALGPGTVGRITLVQARGHIIAAAPVATPPPRPVPAAELGGLEGPVSTIGDDELRHALETLARNVISRSRIDAKSEAET